jgi:glycosyltransferase involved in cell wall biosynthesis
MAKRVAMLVSNACAPDRRVLREAQALAARGHAVRVLAWDREGRHPPSEASSGVLIERIQVPSAYGTGLQRAGQWPAFARSALAFLRGQDWDTVHCHDLDTLPIGYAYARRGRVPLIFDAHESYPDLVARQVPGWTVGILRMLERWLVRRVDALITVGDLLAEHYRPWVRHVTVVRNCPPDRDKGDSDLPDPSSLRASWHLDAVDLVVCYVGGLTRGRIILPLLEAIRADPRLGLVLVGEGPQLEAVKAAAHGVDRVRYLGPRVPPPQVVDLMRASDVVYYGLRSDFPNNRYSSPNALYAALAAGRPLLTTDVGEISHVVQAEECGIVLREPTPAAIARGLKRLRTPEVWAVMAGNARRAAEYKYNWPMAEEALLALYRELWGQP